ncbi:MAG: hypothetical protein ACI9LO_000881 [Planctomycetota bacterium]|jgi:uncharacterized protein (TIGR02647 family)
MHLDSELIEEITLLKRFSMGGPVAMDLHDNPDPAVLDTAQRMFAKGLISASDGGRLTESGEAAVEHLHGLLSFLSPPLEPI